MYYFVVNPVSGNKRSKKVMKKIIKSLDKSDVSHSIIYTTKENGATKVASVLSTPSIVSTFDQSVGPKKVVVVGGDGTFSEFLDGVVDFSSIDVGFIAAGRGNDLARTIGISHNPIKTFKKICENKVRYMDFIQVGENKRCINVCGTGLDVDVLESVAKMKSSSKISYLIGLRRALKNFTPYPIEITLDSETKRYEALLVGVCNGKYFGGGMKVSPNSSVFDGKLQLVVIKMPEGNIWKLLPRFLNGSHIGLNFVEEIVCEQVSVRCVNPEHPVQTDGEVSYSLKLDCKIEKGKLRILN